MLIMRDRQRTTREELLPNLTAKTVSERLVPLLAADALLCTDSAATYQRIAAHAHIHHEPVNLACGEHIREGVFHIQNVNAYDSRLKLWMLRFHGVATKYLHNYLRWRRMIENLVAKANPTAILIQCQGAGSYT